LLIGRIASKNAPDNKKWWRIFACHQLSVVSNYYILHYYMRSFWSVLIEISSLKLKSVQKSAKYAYIFLILFYDCTMMESHKTIKKRSQPGVSASGQDISLMFKKLCKPGL
jgi:hypothetical protein